MNPSSTAAGSRAVGARALGSFALGLLLSTAAGCPSTPQGLTLFITLDRNEGGIRLTDVEPDPF